MSGNVRRSALVLMLAFGGCAGVSTGPGVFEESIIGGTTDSADPRGRPHLRQPPVPRPTARCAPGEVISPHVVLTAAHCAGGEDPSVTNTQLPRLPRLRLRPGHDGRPAAGQRGALPPRLRRQRPRRRQRRRRHHHARRAAGDDRAAAVQPRVDGHASTGSTVRFVGYGLDNATAQTGGGIKRADDDDAHRPHGAAAPLHRRRRTRRATATPAARRS